MKTKMIAIIACVSSIIILTFVMKPKSTYHIIKEYKENVKAYSLDATMEINRGEDVRVYDVMVRYLKDDMDYFKVSLMDKELNQEQIILRNKEGVHVLTPSLNQIFKFEGDWPMNTPKPYLLQTILEVGLQKNAKTTKNDEGMLVEVEVSYPNNKNYCFEKIQFDQVGKVKWLTIENKDHQNEVKLVVRNCDYDAKLKQSDFDVPQEMKQKSSAIMLNEQDLPLYPMQLYGSKLKNAYNMETQDEVKHILEYEGEKAFTIIQSKQQKNPHPSVTLMPGRLYDLIDLFGYYDGNSMNVIYGGVEFSVYSASLSPEEMMGVLNSMQVVVMK